MTQIGQFTRTKSGYTGRIHTLTLDRKLTLVPAESSDAENAPDYRVHRGNGSGSEVGPEVGAAWKRTGEKAGDYLSLQLDDRQSTVRSAPISFSSTPKKTPGHCSVTVL